MINPQHLRSHLCLLLLLPWIVLFSEIFKVCLPEAKVKTFAPAMSAVCSDPAFATSLLTHSKQLYTFAKTHHGFYSDSVADAANFYK